MSAPLQKNASPVLVIIAFAIVYLVWGSTYFFIRMAEEGGIPPLMLGMLRFSTAGILLMVWCAIKKEKLFVAKDLLAMAISGVLLLFMGVGSVIWTEQVLPSGVAAILVSSAPIWFVLLDKSNWAVNLRNKATVIGLIIGFGGVLLLFSEQLGGVVSNTGGKSNWVFMLMLLLGSIAWSFGSLYSKHHPTTVSASVNTAWQMIFAGICFIPASIVHGEFHHLQLSSIHFIGWFSVMYLVLLGSIAAFSAYVWLLQVRPATQVSTYAYVNPVIAVLLGVIFAGEHISFIQVTGLFIILGSVLLINMAKYRKEKRAAELVVE